MKDLLFLFSFTLLIACQPESDVALFKKVSEKYSNVDFANIIIESDSLNALDYEYLYNGSGIGVGDFDANGLPDLFFGGSMVSSQLYLNQGDFKFINVTLPAGLTTEHWCSGIAVVDINEDGLDDIHISTANNQDLQPSKNYFFINQGIENGIPKFKNLADAMGLNDSLHSIQVAFLDYDMDEDLDLFLINNAMENYIRNRPVGQRTDGSGKSTDKLFRNDGIDANGIPKFVDVSKEAGIQIEGWSLGVVVVDINEDNYPDLYITNDFLSNDILYINQQDGTFKNQITDYFKHQSYNSMGIDVSDINNDALDDFIVLDMLPEDNLRRKTMFSDIPFEQYAASIRKDYQPQFVRNVLQVNNGNGIFSDWGYYSGLSATDWSWTPLLADFDDDGWRDAYITNGYKKDVTDLDFINYSSGFNVFGTAEEKRARLIEQLNKMKGIKKTNRFFLNRGQLRFEDQTTLAGLNYPSYSNGAIYADLDGDGDLDIAMNNLNEAAFIFENQSTKNFLNIRLPNDASAYGTKVFVYSKIGIQKATFYPQRGYLSSVDPILHFGLDSLTAIDSIKVIFPNGKQYVKDIVPSNQTLNLHQDMANSQATNKSKETTATYLKQLPNTPIDFQPTPKPFNDFKKWPLHFRSYSQTGTVLASADVNGDGMEDLFIGGNHKQGPKLFLQTSDGFEEALFTVEEQNPYEDVAAVFFDGDNDGDQDLYCVRGSSAFYAQTESYQDRYYENDGQGNFSLRADKLPTIRVAGSCAVPLDYDADGDMDLFVGGRILANDYPAAPRSFLLKNENGYFLDATPESLAHIGMVTDAVALDMNEDELLDLVVVGEWMPIQILYNKNGQYEQATALPKSSGWWNCISKADMDNDGDEDLLVGNWGLNNPFPASPEQPLALHAKDYDDNGAVEAIMTYYNEDKSYIFHPRETLAKRLPGIKSLFNNFSSYGTAEAKTVVNLSPNQPSQHLEAVELASVYIENNTNKNLKIDRLPYPVQAAPVFDWTILDLNKDGHLDVLGVGNYHGVEVLSGQYDALNGITLLGDGKGGFTYVKPSESGFYVPEEATEIEQLKTQNGEILFAVGCRADSLKCFKKRVQNME